MAAQTQRWSRSTSEGDFLISTDVALIDRDYVQTVFASDDAYWAWPLEPEQLETLLAKSITLGLYHDLSGMPPAKTADSPSSPRTPSPTNEDETARRLKQVGMARVVTDGITTAYLTDVYVDAEVRSLGLGKWLIKCCDEIFSSLPAMRRTWLMTSPSVGKRFYSRELGMWDVVEEGQKAVCMTKRYYNLE